MAEAPRGEGFTVAMTRSSDAPGIDIVDPIERRRCTLRTAEPVTPEVADTDIFRFPVETAIEVETTNLSAPFTGQAYVRDKEGAVIMKAPKGYSGSFEPGEYHIELSGLIKVYLHLHAGFTITNSYAGLNIAFEKPASVTIGSRSPHTRPATTVTTPSNPVDVLAAISTFGSALKTLSPERSFPTLRGHPPAIELGDELDIPEDLSPPAREYWIEVPARYEYIYPIVSLSYFLGTRVEPGGAPRIVGDGIDHSLEHPDGYERGVQEVLQRVFLLECATRTEGLYPVELYERRKFEERVDLPFESLYTSSIGERLRAYLDVPFALVEDLVPDWRLCAHVDPIPSNVDMMPFLANDLALVSIAEPEVIADASVSAGIAGFTRGASTSQDTPTTFVKPQGGAEALDTAWVSGGTPVNATKAVPAAYENRIGRTPQDDSIDIAVVCNSTDMEAERDVVDDVYGQHESMPFDVELHEELSCTGLEELLARDFNFLHYIGHIDDDGFRCPDGRLDLRACADIAPEAFFLNACQSYEQGLAMIEGGSIGGIVTLHDVVNHGAVRIGQAVAKLLNGGFPLRKALDVASNESVIGRQYVVVGDGNLSIVQPPSGTPQAYYLERQGSEFSLQVDGFGAPPGMGCMYIPFVSDNSDQYLAEGTTPPFAVNESELAEFLSLENAPVIVDDTLTWSFDVDLRDL